ncbi:hypothetical protein DACRYDRAFT_20064 [Dacryopinax primogenitus]|uniref:Uncharacterized protein n=1 Tax=Dacryopinax primogenitus (strain DJM 731) TaxID=1858805 RepID=M5GB63_DACPD|nr:uncharacterized protein DACRYDRAFT_20064 [Dacryopinax primogenitus]EJU05635.1 hypothetical protein DACRYDRAFT_20064 [Dacryopinax primogenitus]
MVQLALAVASVLVLPSLSSIGAYAVPLPAAIVVPEQVVVHSPENAMSAEFEARFNRPMAFYRERELANQENSGWSSRLHRRKRAALVAEQSLSTESGAINPAAVQLKPTFIQRRSRPVNPVAAHIRPSKPRFASGKGRRQNDVYGGMYTSSVLHGANTGIKARQASAGPAAGVPGKVSVVAASNSSQPNVDLTIAVDPIASLVFSLDSNSTTGVIKATASADNHTTLYLTPTSSNVTTLPDPSTLLVNLKMAVFDPDRAALIQYCATYDPSPSNGSSITAEPCQTVTAAHSSQVFIYSPASGVVHPLWSQDMAVVGGLGGSNMSSLFSNSSGDSDTNVKITNTTSTVITQADSHYMTNALFSASNATTPLAPDSQSLFELVFVPDSAEFLVAAPANVTEGLNPHMAMVGSYSQSAPPTFTGAAPTMPLAVNASSVHLAAALLPMIPLPDSTDGTPAPTPTGRR